MLLPSDKLFRFEQLPNTKSFISVAPPSIETDIIVSFEEKIDEYEAKCTIYIWAPDGREFDEVPDQFYEDPITWKSSIFGEQFPDVVFETSTAYLMHDGGCCCLIGTVGHP